MRRPFASDRHATKKAMKGRREDISDYAKLYYGPICYTEYLIYYVCARACVTVRKGVRNGESYVMQK